MTPRRIPPRPPPVRRRPGSCAAGAPRRNRTGAIQLRIEGNIMTGESWPTGGNAVADGIAQVSAAPAGGLSSAEAADRLARYGPNELPRARATPWWRLVADQLRDPLILVLLAAAALTVATGDLA